MCRTILEEMEQFGMSKDNYHDTFVTRVYHTLAKYYGKTITKKLRNIIVNELRSMHSQKETPVGGCDHPAVDILREGNYRWCTKCGTLWAWDGSHYLERLPKNITQGLYEKKI